MNLALADAVVAYLNAQVTVNPGLFPSGLTWAAQRVYEVLTFLTGLGSSNPVTQPLVLVIPGGDPETVSGISGSTYASDGEYSTRVLILAFAGAPQPGETAAFNALLDPLMNLRQSIRRILKLPGALGPIAGYANANATATRIENGDNGPLGFAYDFAMLRDNQIFSSDQNIVFEIAPV